MQLFVAAKAVITNDLGQVLVLKEQVSEEGTNAEKWGLPGGRLNLGERFLNGLAREVMEETGLVVKVGYPVMVGEWHPVIKGEERQIIAVFVACKAESSAKIFLSEEHDDFKWITEENISHLIFMQPDDEVIKRYFSNPEAFFKEGA